MTKRAPISVLQPLFTDAQIVDAEDLDTLQTAQDGIVSSIVNNQIGYGIVPQNLINAVIFDSSQFVGYLDGLPITTQNQPSDPNLGCQLSINLTGSNVAGNRRIKVGIIGLDFQEGLQYETFYFDTNNSQITKKHYTQILVLLFNDIRGNPTLSFNLGGILTITEANPMSLSPDVIMIAQDQQPNLFFRDFFLDPSVAQTNVVDMLTVFLPLYQISNLNIQTQSLNLLPLLSGDVTTQIGQKFQATTNNIQKVTLLLSVRNLASGQQNNLVWTGDIIVSIYPLQTSIDCPTDFLPNLPIDFSPFNIPLAQISFNYTSLQNAGTLLNSVSQPVDFIFSNSPIAGGNLMTPGQYYAVTIKRSGAANQCDILIATGQDILPNSELTTFASTLWVDISDQDMWFKIWTDAAKVSDGQAYDAGHGVIIPKTTLDPTTQATIDYSFGAQQFTGNGLFSAVLAAVSQDSVPVPDQRTGDPVDTRQQYVPQVTLTNAIDLANLEKASEPLVLGTISDSNIKFFDPSQSLVNAPLFSATMAGNELLIRIVDDPTDTVRFNAQVNGLASILLNGGLIAAEIIPDNSSPSIFYRIASASLCSMILGDVNGDGIIDETDLALLNTFLGYNLNVGLPDHTIIATDGYTTTTFANGYQTLTQPFANLFNISFQLVDPNTNTIVASGTDGILVANPNDPTLANFTSSMVNFDIIIGLSSYQLVILSNAVNEADWGGFNIVSLDSVADVVTIQKVFLTGDSIAQMLRADINGDFIITTADGYLLDNYIERQISSYIPPVTYPAPSTNPYTKIGTRFNVIRMQLEEFVDRSDDYAANPNVRDATVHPLQDIFAADGYLAGHDFYHSPIQMSITKELVWEPSLVVASTQSKLVPAVFTSELGFVQNSCSIDGVQCNVYPVPQPFDPGRVDCFVPNNLILGDGGELQRPDGDFYKVDFEVGTIILEIPDGLFSAEKTLDLMGDFIVDYTGNGATRLGFPSMRFADCSFVNNDALANDQLRFSVAVQSFSPNSNGLDPDGYYGAIVDGKMGVSIDFSTGLLTLNFTNLYQDAVLQTLSTKVQVNVFLKKGGFNNTPLFVDSTKVGNMLSLVSVFSGANVGGPSALVDLGNDITGILPIVSGGTGLNGVGPIGTILTSTGNGTAWEFGGGGGGGLIQLTGPVTGSGSGIIATTITPGSNGQILTTIGGSAIWENNPAITDIIGDVIANGPGIATATITNLAVSKLAPSSTDGYVITSVSGVAEWAPPTGGGGGGGFTTLIGDTTGSGAGTIVTTTGLIHGASVPVAGALVTGNVLRVSGASALSYSALNLAGGAGWISGNLPLANFTPGSNGQILTTTAGVPAWETFSASILPTITLTGQVTGSGSGGIINTTLISSNLPSITLTGQVTGSAAGGTITTSLTSANLPTITLTGAVTGSASGGTIVTTLSGGGGGATSLTGDTTGTAVGTNIPTVTVKAQNGVFTFTTGGTLQWSATSTWLMDQASTASAVAANSIWQPQQSTSTPGTGGNALVNLMTPLGAGTEAYFGVTRGGSGNLIAAIGPTPTLGTSLTSLFLHITAPSVSNHVLRSDGSNTFLNAPSADISFTTGAAAIAHLSNSIVFGSSTFWLNNALGSTTTNYILQSDGFSHSYVNGVGNVLGLALGGSGFAQYMTLAGIRLFDSNQYFGSGTNVLSMAFSGTLPTTNITSGLALAADGNGLHFYIGSALNCAILGQTSGFGALWLTMGSTSPTVNNYSLLSDSSNTDLNAPSGSINFRVTNTTYATMNTTTLSTSIGLNIGIGTSTDFGGGTNVFSLREANIMPTTVSTSGSILAVDSFGLHVFASGTTFSDQVIAPEWVGTLNTQSTQRYAFSVIGTTANSNLTIASIAVPNNNSVALYFTAVARNTNGAGEVGRTATTQYAVVWKNISGALSQATGNPGSATWNIIDTTMSAATLSLSTFNSGANVQVQVSSNSSTGTIDWVVHIDACFN